MHFIIFVHLNMKIKPIILFFTILFVSFLYSAEYKGKNLDGIEFDCTAYSYDTEKFYSVTVQFSGNEATIYFENGISTTLTLDEEIIDDPSAIQAYDYDTSVDWELDIDELY